MNLDEKKIIGDARRFFLGAMSVAERELFESGVIEQSAVFDLVRAEEDELVEQYLRNVLSNRDRAAFEANYLTAESNRRRVDFTRQMLAAVRSKSPVEEKSSLWKSINAFFAANRLAVGAAFVLLIATGVVLLIVSRDRPVEVVQSMPEEKNPVVSTQPTPQSANVSVVVPTPVASPTVVPKSQNENVQPPKPAEPKTSPVLALFAGTLRSGGSMPTLNLDADVATARLRLNLESADYNLYTVEIADANGNVVSRTNRIRAAGKQIDISVPAARLANGEFVVKLSGINDKRETESAADFSFRVMRRSSK